MRLFEVRPNREGESQAGTPRHAGGAVLPITPDTPRLAVQPSSHPRMAPARRSSAATAADAAQTEAAPAASARKKKTTRKAASESVDASGGAEPGPSSAQDAARSDLRSRERLIEEVKSRPWHKPKSLPAQLMAFIKLSFFRVDFTMGTYFFDWWESLIVCGLYGLVLSLIAYSVLKQAARAAIAVWEAREWLSQWQPTGLFTS